MTLQQALFDYCKLTLSVEETDRWLATLQRTYRTLSEQDVATVIEWASWHTKDMKIKTFRPSLSEVRMWVGMYQKARIKDAEPQRSECMGCGGNGWFGWGNMYRMLRPDVATFDFAVPCACSQGTKWWDFYYPRGAIFEGKKVGRETIVDIVRKAIYARKEIDAEITRHWKGHPFALHEALKLIAASPSE